MSGRDPFTVFWKKTNDWNQFTLLEAILDYYVKGFKYGFLNIGQGQLYDEPHPGSRLISMRSRFGRKSNARCWCSKSTMLSNRAFIPGVTPHPVRRRRRQRINHR